MKEIDDNKVMRVFSASVYTQCGIEKWVEIFSGGACIYIVQFPLVFVSCKVHIFLDEHTNSKKSSTFFDIT